MGNEDEYLGLVKAAQRLRVSRPKLTRMVADDQVPSFADPLDKRRILLRLSDLERLRKPQPRTGRSVA